MQEKFHDFRKIGGVVGCRVCRSYRTLSVPSSRHITFLSACLVSYFQVVSLALSGGEQAPTLPPPDVAAAADCMHADSGGLCRHIREVFICDTKIPPEIMMYCPGMEEILEELPVPGFYSLLRFTYLCNLHAFQMLL